jgi:hypothetical protein
MKTRNFTFYFKGGAITVRAFNENEAKILAQAKAIENGWDYTIQKQPTMSRREARAYLQNVIDTWTEFCKEHPRFALAIKVLLGTEN